MNDTTATEIGFIGLGRMGGNMVKRLREGDHRVLAFDPNGQARQDAENSGVVTFDSLQGFVDGLATPRVIWLMVPSIAIVESTITKLADLCDPGDLIIDGGNSRFHDSKARGLMLAKRGIDFLDVGVSGGVWGLEKGYCMMVGGSDSSVNFIRPLLDTLAPPDGWRHVGPSGAGHYAKMIHNGIEYGMLQAMGEGFEILEHSEYDFDLADLSHLWNQGSVIRSWLMELAELAFADPSFKDIDDYVEDTGEGRWTVQEAIDLNVPAPVLTTSLLQRFASRQEESFAAKSIAALRRQFGGHAVKERHGR